MTSSTKRFTRPPRGHGKRFLGHPLLPKCGIGEGTFNPIRINGHRGHLGQAKKSKASENPNRLVSNWTSSSHSIWQSVGWRSRSRYCGSHWLSSPSAWGRLVPGLVWYAQPEMERSCVSTARPAAGSCAKICDVP